MKMNGDGFGLNADICKTYSILLNAKTPFYAQMPGLLIDPGTEYPSE